MASVLLSSKGRPRLGSCSFGLGIIVIGPSLGWIGSWSLFGHEASSDVIAISELLNLEFVLRHNNILYYIVSSEFELLNRQILNL